MKTKLIQLRKKKGLSQLELAEELKISRQAVSRWEAGIAIPSIDNLKCLGELYGIPVDVLLDDDSEWPYQHEKNKRNIETKNAGKHKKVRIATVIFAVLFFIGLVFIIISREKEEITPIDVMDGVQWDTSDSDVFSVEW